MQRVDEKDQRQQEPEVAAAYADRQELERACTDRQENRVFGGKVYGAQQSWERHIKPLHGDRIRRARTMKMERVVAHAPSYGALLIERRRLVRLALDAEI